MPALPQLTYSWDSPAVAVSRVRLAGNLVNENADLLLEAIIEDLSVHPGVRELHVANRGQALRHLLERTGTAEYLVGAPCAAVPDEETSG